MSKVPSLEPAMLREEPLAGIIISAVDILTAAEEATGLATAETMNKEGLENLRQAVGQVKALMAISAERARTSGASMLRDVNECVEAIKFGLSVQPNPYTWAVTNFSDSALASFNPLLVPYIKQTLREYFDPLDRHYDGWDD